MTKQDYEYLALRVKQHIQTIEEETQYSETENTIAEVKYAVRYFETVMKMDNPKFDRLRFEKACGFNLWG